MDSFFIFLVINIFFIFYILIHIVSASEIILTIYEKGNQAILNQSFSPEPNAVFVNNIKRNDCKKFCDLSSYNSEIKLQFNDYIYSCENMFNGLNITEIDLSKFDFSEVTSMKSMFELCIYLESINFGNIIYLIYYPFRNP